MRLQEKSMNFQQNKITRLLIFCLIFNALQASSSEKTLQELTQELIHAVENATANEGLVEKTAKCKKIEQENINRLRTEVAQAAMEAGQEYKLKQACC